MLEYIWIFFWLLGAGYVISHSRSYRPETVAGIEESPMRLTPGRAFVLILPIILMAGYRDFWYADTGAYYEKFLSYPTTFSGFVAYLPTLTKDVGFYGMSAFIKLLYNSPRLYFVIIAFFQGICLMKFFRRYSDDYVLSLFLFVASTNLYEWMFNGLRQFVAVAITLLGAHLYLTRRYVPGIVVILIASLFHGSALLMLPFIFIVQGEAWNKKTLLFMAFAVLAVAFVDRFTNIMDMLLEGTQYENVVDDYTSWNDDGTNPLRVLVYSLPAVLSFICRRQIRASGNTLINFCANMSIVSAGLFLISMVTSGIYIGRLPIYFSLYGYILLPWEIRNLFTKKSYNQMLLLMIGFYMAFYMYSMFIA